jgi:hypothetical protein
MPEAEIAYPEWTEYRTKNGLDPLGMQNGSVNLYQRLLPGISNVTLRVRYYGFYTWLASLYAKKDGSTDLRGWQRIVRRAEALYALTSCHHGDLTGVAGIRWASRHLAATSSRMVEFAANADPEGSGTRYLKQAWGAYGAAYGSQLFETGVLAQADAHAIPVPSPEFGDPLAGAINDALGPLVGRFYSAIRRGSVSRAELDDFAPMIPSTISRKTGERQLYQNLLFARGPLDRPEDLARRDTLLLLLHIAGHLGQAPDPASVRWIMYAGRDQQGRTFKPLGARLAEHCTRWRIYQANDLLHFAYGTLLAFALCTLEAYPQGITLERLIAECVSQLSEVAPAWPSKWSEFVDQNQPSANPWSPKSDKSEFSLVREIPTGDAAETATDADAAWRALQLIAIVAARSEEDAPAINAELGSLDRDGFHTLVTERAFLASLQQAEFGTACSRIIRERVINRHLWVAHRKFRYQGDYTFLLEADEGRVRLRGPSGPVFTSPRLGPAISFLFDLRLIDKGGLTAAGRKLAEIA